MSTILSSIYSFGGPGVLIILLVILLLFGAKRLPELARGLGQAINEFNKAKDDVQRQISRADEPAVKRPDELKEHRAAAATTAAAAASTAAPATAATPSAPAAAPAPEQTAAAQPSANNPPA